MAATSTNKSPLLIDRPLHEVARLDQTSHPGGTLDPGTGVNGVLLVDATGTSDGAVLDTIYLIQRFSDDESVVNLYFSTSNQILGTTTTGGQANAWFINTCKFPVGADPGLFIEFSLPFVLSPIPHAQGDSELVNGPIASSLTNGLQQAARFRSLYVPRGKALWAAVFSPTPNPEAPNIACQGGWF
jgi:hypothetical protein